jgi:nucleoside-diphosphate-sugar epimerase
MNTAVLGATGFVGGHLLRYLRASGHDVRAIVRRRLPDTESNYRIADACDVYALRDALRGCDYLIHAALGSNEVIVDSVAPVYAAAEAVGIRRLVYISTGTVHGQAPAHGTDETTPLSGRQAFAYNNAKVEAERRLKRLRSRGSVELVVLRPTIVFGPGSRWVYDFADRLQDGTAYVVDGARAICTSIYVDNLSQAALLALTTSGIDREVFLVADAETVRWCDLYRPIADSFGVDFDSVPSVAPPPEVPLTFRQLYVDPIRASGPGRFVIRQLPVGLKRGVKGLVRIVRRRARADQPREAAGLSHAATSFAPVIPDEIAALQRCQWRLPHDKAARMLHYVPPVSFADGCRRSIEWVHARSRPPRLAR